MADIISRTVDAQIARAEKFGFIPMTYEPDLKGQRAAKNGQSDRLGRHAAELAPDLKTADEKLSAKHADEIIRQLEWYQATHNREHLKLAEKYAAEAYPLFCDEKCPLPKAFAGPLRKTLAGETFPDFYLRGARLMLAFALLGEVRGARKRDYFPLSSLINHDEVAERKATSSVGRVGVKPQSRKDKPIERE